MKIRVLETIRQGLIGGGETHLLSLVENLDKSVFEPVVLSFTEGPMVERLKGMGIETYVIHSERPFDIAVWGKVRKFIESRDIDIVHAHGTRAASNVLRAARSLGLPILYTVHGWSFHDDQNPLVKSLRMKGEQYLTGKMDINISVSASNQETGKKLLKGFESVVIANGIDQNKFDPARSFKDIRKELGIPEDAIVVLFMARFTNHKQPLKVIKGFHEAARTVPSLRLLMVGEGDARPEALELVRELNIGDKVYFQDFRQDVPDVLAAADIFVLASLWEGLAISLLEAMSMGKAVVASNVDGNSEVVSHMENGWLADIKELEKNLAQAFISLSQDRSLRGRLERNAVDTINNQYNAGTMTKRTEELYHAVLKKRGRAVLEKRGGPALDKSAGPVLGKSAGSILEKRSEP